MKITDFIRDDALVSIKEGKLNDGFSVIFKNDLSPRETETFKELFYKTADDWVQNKNIFVVLTKADKPDLELAKEVLKSDNYHEFVRNSAFEIILDRDTNIISDTIKTSLLDPDSRRSAVQTINNRLDKYSSKNEISKEKMIALIIPLRPLLEDIILLSDDYEAKDIQNIINALDSATPQTAEQYLQTCQIFLHFTFAFKISTSNSS